MNKLDSYSMKMLKRIQEADGSMDVVNMTFVTDNISKWAPFIQL